MEIAYVILGSNIDPFLHLVQAFAELGELPQTQLIAKSSFYASPFIGGENQADVINVAVKLTTTLSALDLLSALLLMEQKHNRVRNGVLGARTLDCDLLLYGHEIFESEMLTIPHPRMKQRAFVLVPLNDIAPDLVLPDGTKVNDLLKQCADPLPTKLEKSL